MERAGRYHVKTIFLATDDEEVILETKKWPQFAWLFQPGLERGELKKVRWEQNLLKNRYDNYGEVPCPLSAMPGILCWSLFFVLLNSSCSSFLYSTFFFCFSDFNLQLQLRLQLLLLRRPGLLFLLLRPFKGPSDARGPAAAGRGRPPRR